MSVRQQHRIDKLVQGLTQQYMIQTQILSIESPALLYRVSTENDKLQGEKHSQLPVWLPPFDSFQLVSAEVLINFCCC